MTKLILNQSINGGVVVYFAVEPKLKIDKTGSNGIGSRRINRLQPNQMLIINNNNIIL